MTDCLVGRVDCGSETGIKKSRMELMGWEKTGAFKKSRPQKEWLNAASLIAREGKIK